MIGRLLPLVMAGLLAACAETAAPPPGPSAGPAPPSGVPVAAGDPALAGDDLAGTVIARLHGADGKAYRAVSAKSAGGEVLLTGAVTKPVLRRRAEAAALGVPGVTGVHDSLFLAEDGALDRFLPDAARERAVAARLAGDPAAAGLGVRVVDGAAYLVGTVASPADLAQVKTLLLADPDLKWVDTGAVAITRR